MINKIDREFIENKYHRTDKSFNSLNRMAYHGIGYAEETGKDDVEILAGLKSNAAGAEALCRTLWRELRQ